MKRIRNSRSIRLFAISLCIFSSSILLVYGFKTKFFSGSATEGDDSFSNTLYMSIKNSDASPVITFTGNEENTTPVPDTEQKEPGTDAPEAQGFTSTEKVSTPPEFTSLSPDFSGIEYVNVLLSGEKRTVKMSLEEYVAGAVASEMPASAPAEALKAQAVACRTLAVNLILGTDKTAHGGADICTSSGHCQSYTAKEQFVSRYGEAGAKCYENAENAAKATKGIILLYNSKPIVAAFHASSGEYTASSEEIWGGRLDYLVSVKTEESENSSYNSQVFEKKSFTKSRFIEKLKSAGVGDFSQYAESDFHQWISTITRSASGRVTSIEIGNKKVSGSSLKSIFGLKSTDFSVSFEGDTITFETRGYGHGVGMSQLGASSMAENGSSFYEILKYYYSGVSFGIIGK